MIIKIDTHANSCFYIKIFDIHYNASNAIESNDYFYWHGNVWDDRLMASEFKSAKIVNYEEGNKQDQLIIDHWRIFNKKDFLKDWYNQEITNVIEFECLLGMINQVNFNKDLLVDELKKEKLKKSSKKKN